MIATRNSENSIPLEDFSHLAPKSADATTFEMSPSFSITCIPRAQISQHDSPLTKLGARIKGCDLEEPRDPVTDIFGSSPMEQDATNSILLITRRTSCDTDQPWTAFLRDDTVFICPPRVAQWSESEFRSCIVSVLDLAEQLKCDKLVVALEKDRKDLKELVRAFGYVGFEVVLPTVYRHNQRYLLFGYQI